MVPAHSNEAKRISISNPLFSSLCALQGHLAAAYATSSPGDTVTRQRRSTRGSMSCKHDVIARWANDVTSTSGTSV